MFVVFVLLARRSRDSKEASRIRSKSSEGVDRNAFGGRAERKREGIRGGRERTSCRFCRADICMYTQSAQNTKTFATMLKSRPG